MVPGYVIVYGRSLVIWYDILLFCCEFRYRNSVHNYTLPAGHKSNHREISLGSERINILRPRQNSRHFADEIFKCIFLLENILTWINVLLNFVPKGLVDSIVTLIQIMTCRQLGDKPLSETKMVNLLTHICVTRPHWLKVVGLWHSGWENGDLML